MTTFLRRALFTALLSLPVVAQPGSTGSGSAWVSLPGATLTNDVYWAAQVPEVQALRKMLTGRARDEAGLALAQRGFIIDVPIHVWGWEAPVVMFMRAQYGFTWVNNALEPPGGGNGPVPPGKIKVSIDAKDYPAFPKPQPPAVGTNVVGAQLFNNVFTYGPGAIKDGKFIVKDGDLVTQDGRTFKARVNAFAIGTQVFFEAQ